MDEPKFGGTAYCPHCLNKLDFLLPVEPLYDLALAAQLIPQTPDALRKYLSTHSHEFQRRYRRDRQKRLHRMLTASEIRLIRSRIIKFKDANKKYRKADIVGN